MRPERKTGRASRKRSAHVCTEQGKQIESVSHEDLDDIDRCSRLCVVDRGS
jgi:hypothetical protein